jgi:hypothetical protein
MGSRGGRIRRPEPDRAVRGGMALAIAVALAAQASARAADLEFTPSRVEASFTSDSNVNRGSSGEAISDRFLGVRAGKGLVLPVSTHMRAVVQAFAGGEKFSANNGLSHGFVGAQGDLQYRSSGTFGAATYGAFLRTQAEFYESDLRDGYRHAYGITFLKPVTDRVQFLVTIQQNISDGKSTVFDTKSTTFRGFVDWSLGRLDTAYLGLEYRKGDTVSTGVQTLARINAADAIVQDDAFNNPALFAYRFKAGTWLAAVGYNHAFSGGQSLDISWRYARSKPQQQPSSGSASDLEYVANQFSLAYLVRF